MTSAKAYWFSGLSGSGKTTVATSLYTALRKHHAAVCMLDGDVMRCGLCKDLGFDKESRMENMRRIAEVTKLFLAVEIPVIAAFISPYKDGRELVRSILPQGAFLEIYLSTPLEECERRDPKGLYKQARRGDIAHFTGITSPYEVPENPEVVLNTALVPVDICVQRILCTRAGHPQPLGELYLVR